MKKQLFAAAVVNALHGLKDTLRNERNFRLQGIAAVAVTTVLLVTRPGALWIALVVLAIGAVLVAELLNTALERLCDHVNPRQHAEIRTVKDCGAAAVLVATLVAVAVAVCFALRFLG